MDAASNSVLGKRGGAKTKPKPDSKKKKNGADHAETAAPLCTASDDASITKIGKIKAKDKFVNVRGKVIFSTLVHEWKSGKGEGVKMYFDLADETGIIRVIAWNDIAEIAGKIAKRGQSLELNHVEVQLKRPAFNNLDHHFQLKLSDDNASLEILELENNSIQAMNLQVRFTPFEDVPDKAENQYFDLSGQIENFQRCLGGIRDEIEISDDVGNELVLASYNNYISLCTSMIGKKIEVIRGKYNDKYGSVDLTGAHIKIGGKFVKKYHLSDRDRSDSDTD